MKRSSRLVAGVLVAGVLALTGCSGSANKSESGSAGGRLPEPGRVAAGVAPGVAVATTAQAGAGSAGASGSTPSTSTDRSIVRTAAVTVSVKDVDTSADRIAALVSKVGERVDGDQRSNDADARTAQLTLRVLPGRLDDVIAAIDKMGKELSRTVKGEDVTATRADIDARISALATSVARLQRFLSESTSVPNLLALEKQLSDRQGELDAMRARQRALGDEISLATLTVQVVQNGTPVVARRESGPAGFGSALAAGWHGLVLALLWVLAALGYALPVGVVTALLGFAGALFWRRNRRHRMQPALATTGPDQRPGGEFQ